MDKTQALEKLRSIGQQHLFKFFDELSSEDQINFLEQIDTLNIPTFRMQQQVLESHHHYPLRLLDPFVNYSLSGNHNDTSIGQRLINEGKVGCLIIAGGQGTRLKVNGPKGMYPVSLIKRKSLFQLFAEKVLAASHLAERKLEIAVMTSKINHQQTLDFFEENSFFGLDPMQVSFFTQGTLPLLSHEGDLFLETKGHIAVGPDGNGSTLQHFFNSSICNDWYTKGIRYVNTILIDNPLADPFDAELIGHQKNQGADVLIKCSTRNSAKENVGVLVNHEGKVKVIEYSELPEEEKSATDESGLLKHRCANLSLFCFSIDFIKKVSKTELPLHLAHKAAPFLDEEGSTIHPAKPNAWKFEKFIFDVLPYALKVRALLYPREECFAPLKNAHGDASLESVQKSLLKRDREVISKLTGKTPPEVPIELSQEFYYPTENLKKQWEGKSIENGGYIQPTN